MSDIDRNTDRTDDSEGRHAAVNDARRDIDQLAQADGSRDSGYRGSHQYRRGAVALGILGLLALAGTLEFPDARSILLALAGIGLFGAILLGYLTPDRSVAPATGDSVYAAFARTGEELISELELRDERIYVPAAGDDGPGPSVRLFVPARADLEVPSPAETSSLSIVSEDGRTIGITVPPTGGDLYDEFRTRVEPALAEEPGVLADQIADALQNQFDLVYEAAPNIEPGGGTIQVTGSNFGPIDRFDHPAVSFSAVAFADVLDRPVRVSVTSGRRATDCRITYRWDKVPATE